MSVDRKGDNDGPGLRAGDESAESRGLVHLARLAWLPIPLLTAAIIAARVLGFSESYKSEALTLVLSLSFYTLVSLGTLFLIGRNFLKSGAPGLLLLECGVIMWCLAGTVGDAVSHGDGNVNVTIFNSAILLAGLCHLAGAALSARPKHILRATPLWLTTGFLLSLGMLYLITHATLQGWLPVFFVPGQGGTMVRQLVLATAIAVFLLSSRLVLGSRDRKRAPFASWYAMALLLLAVGLFGVMIQTSLGSVVNWLGRAAQWLGGLYLLIASVTALRESNLPLFPSGERPRPELYRYGVAAAIVLAATALRLAFLPSLEMRFTFVTFFPAVTLAALYGGFGAGLLATILSGLAADYFWIHPVGRFGIENPADWVGLLFFAVSCIMICLIIEAMHRARVRLSEQQNRLQELVKDRTAELDREIQERREAQAKVQEKEDILQQALNVSSSFVFDWDTGSDQIYRSESCRDIFGIDADELCGATAERFLRSIHPDDRARCYRTFHDLTPAADSYTTDFRLALSDGSVVTLEETAQAFFDSAGKAVRVLGVTHDITERKKAEEALRESEARERERAAEMTALFKAVPTPVFIAHDPACLHISGNPAADALLRIPPGSEASLDAPPEQRPRHYRVLKDGRELASDELPAQLAARGFEVRDFEFTIAFDDGAARQVVGYATPLRDEAGHPRGGVLAVLDITERKLAEDVLRKSRDELEIRVQERTAELQTSEETTRQQKMEIESYYHTAPVGLCVLDTDSRFVRINEHLAGVNGLPVSDHIGRTVRELLPSLADRIEGIAGHVVKTGESVVNVEIAGETSAQPGVPRTWVVSWYPLKDAGAKVTGISVVVQEVTEQRRLEERVRQSQKMEAIGTLAGGIAHDFNNILAAIIGFTEMAMDDVEDRPLVGKNLQRVMKSAMRARDLVKQILTFSRKSSNERSPLALGPVIRETVDLLRASIPKTIDMRLSFRTASDTVLASPIEIQQILMNLATNASLAMEETGGVMEISLADTDFEPDPMRQGGNDCVKITVKDTGCGMSPEVVKRVFEPFYTTREVGKGSGMGLAVVYGIVMDLQGTITVESEERAGSTFRVFLPRAEIDTGPEPVERPEFAGGKERILFIDDEEMLAEWGKSTLERLGYQVTAVTDSREGLSAFSADPAAFDLVITDHAMPLMAGSQLSQELLRIRKDIPIILCTGHTEMLTREKAKEMGIGEFLMKPLAKKELADAVRRLLDGKPAAP